jgi:exopolysaccharide biosynthesis WecB/TagA/CpsF family protein
LFDFLSGMRSRAPKAVQAMGMEWAYRMALEPQRLGWRYATTNVTAAVAMARDSRSAPLH